MIVNMATKYTVCILLLLLVFITNTSCSTIQEPMAVPVAAGRIEYRVMAAIDGGGRRRKLSPFQVCLVCRCCVTATDPTTCSNMPCCFGIDCQLPNKPFGVCAFVPKTCNCTTCASH